MPNPPFFTTSRHNVLSTVRIIGDRMCCYSGGEWPRRCDCKYGGPVKSQGSEQTGCPELANLAWLLERLTDEEYAEIMCRPAPAPAPDSAEERTEKGLQA